MNKFDVARINGFLIKSRTNKSFLYALVSFASDLSFVDKDKNVSEVRDGVNKVIKLVAVENVGVKRIGETIFGLLNPVDGRVSSDDENMLNRNGNGVNRNEMVNGGKHSAGFARLCKCNGKNRMNRAVFEFVSNARAKGNLVREKFRKFRIKFVRDGASVFGASLGSNDSIGES